jgi:PAS domain S-box-containing protein
VNAVTRVLVVEDDAAIRQLVTSRLAREGMHVTEAATVATGLTELRRAIFDVAILDLTFPDGSGLDLLEALREQAVATHVIILSGAGSEADRVRALEIGADDYVVKPFFVRELVARILAVGRRRRGVETNMLQHGSITIDLAARRVTVHDAPVSLTAKEFDLLAFLAARPGHAFSRGELLRSVWQSATDWQQPATVTEHVRRLRLKIEAEPGEPRFLQTVHGVGYRFEPDVPEQSADESVRSATDPSARLRHVVTGVTSDVSDAVIVTDNDLRVRSWNPAAERLYGWAEQEVIGRYLFDVVPFADDDDDGLASVLQALEEKGRWFAEVRQVARDGSYVSVSASTTRVADEDGAPVAVVSVNRASAGGHAVVASPQSHNEVDIRRGLDDAEFDVFYQPVVALDDHRVITVEALVRWNHRDRGILAPASFIDTAERSGMMLELGRVVFNSACRQTAAWRNAGHNVEVAVNLSTKQLGDPALFDDVTACLAASGLDPRALWLEVTETA